MIRKPAQRKQRPFPQESGSGWRKDKASGWLFLVWVRCEFILVLSQCRLGDKKRMRLIKNVYGKGSLLEQVEKKTKGYWLSHTTHTTTVLRPFYRDHLGEPVPEENFWTLWYKGRLTEADTPTIRLGTTRSGLTCAHLHHPQFLQAGCPSCCTTNSVKALTATSAFGLGRKTIEFSSTELPAPSPYPPSIPG